MHTDCMTYLENRMSLFVPCNIDRCVVVFACEFGHVKSVHSMRQFGIAGVQATAVVVV